MDVYVVLFKDAYGYSEVRKLSRSLAMAQNYVTAALTEGFATDISWAYLPNTTECWANARFRGTHAGFEPVTFTIQHREMHD